MNGVIKPTVGRIVIVKSPERQSPAIVQGLVEERAPLYLRCCVFADNFPPRNVVVPHEAQVPVDYIGEVWAWPARVT
jgi:hypothetical protein